MTDGYTKREEKEDKNCKFATIRLLQLNLSGEMKMCVKCSNLPFFAKAESQFTAMDSIPCMRKTVINMQLMGME